MKKAYSKTPDHIRASICAEYVGWNGNKLAAKYGIAYPTVYKILRENGIDTATIRHEKEDEIVNDYLSGMSSRGIGKKYDCDKKTVTNILRRHGHEPRQYHAEVVETIEYKGVLFHRWPESKYRHGRNYYRGYWHGKYDNYHRVLWQEWHGTIPDGCDIHHKDKNTDNNTIDNLECLAHADHTSLHQREKPDKKIGIECLVCGEVMNVFPCRVGIKKYCSIACKSQGRSG